MFNGAGKALFQELWKLCNSKLIGRQSTTTDETDWLHIAGVKLSGISDCLLLCSCVLCKSIFRCS